MACVRASNDGRLFVEESRLTVFTHTPSWWSRFVWALAESLGILPRAYLAALTDVALLDKAEVLIRLGDPPKAQRVLDALARRAIDDPRVLGQLANLELRNGNKDVARRAQLRAAQAYLQRGMVDEAVHVLQQILAVARDCLEARLALGQIAEGRYGHEEAVAHYLEAVKVLQARQESEGVAELLDRIRQLNRVKTVLDSETQMMQPQLPAGRAQVLLAAGPIPADADPPLDVQREVDADDGATQLDMRGPISRTPARPVIADVATERGAPLQTLTEADTVADMPSPLYAGVARRGRDLPRNPRAPSTVIVEPDLAFPDTTDPASAPPAPPAPPIPSTFVRSHSPSPHDRRGADADEPGWAGDPRDAQIKQPTDIVMRDALPAELLIKVDTAVDFVPGRLKAATAGPSPVVVVPASAVSTDATEALARPVSAPPSGTRDRRNHSVWERAIVRGPREAITLNVGPEPEPLEPGTPSILRRATSGISSALDGFLSNVSGPKDGGGTKS